MAKRTPIDGTSNGPADRRVERLPDPDDSDVFDEALVPDPCPAAVLAQGVRVPCIRPFGHEGDHDPGPLRADVASDLAAVPSPPGPASQMADPAPPAPGIRPGVPEPSRTAGSGGGAGRSLVIPDAGEKVLGAAMGVINPVADPAYAIRHAEEQARVLIIGQHFANMLQAISPPTSRLVDDDDLRGIYRKVRQMAATRGLDLDDEAAS